MNFDWINFLLDRHDKIVDNVVIDLLDYHYKVDNIYDEFVIVDLDVDTCDIVINQKIKLLNNIYKVLNIEFIPSNIKYRYRLTLTNLND